MSRFSLDQKEFYFLLVENGLARQLHYGNIGSNGQVQSFRRVEVRSLKIRQLPFSKRVSYYDDGLSLYRAYITDQRAACMLDPICRGYYGGADGKAETTHDYATIERKFCNFTEGS